MGQNKKHITPQNVTSWLCSTGFLFPRNEVELARFDRIYGDEDFRLTGMEIDPLKIISGEKKEVKTAKLPVSLNSKSITELRMAARNGKALPKHIADKIKKNQSKSDDDDTTE